MLTPNWDELRVAFECLDRAPRETAFELLNQPEDGLDECVHLHLRFLAKHYWEHAQQPRADLSPSELERALVSASRHAFKLFEILQTLPSIDDSKTIKAFNGSKWIIVQRRDPPEVIDGALVDEIYSYSNPYDRWMELSRLSSFLKDWAGKIEVNRVPEGRTPPKRLVGNWTDEAGLALNIAAMCHHHGRPLPHARLITKAVIDWATPKGGKPKRFGKQDWKMVVQQFKATSNLVVK